MRTSIQGELGALVSVLGVLTLSACSSARIADAPLAREAEALGSGAQVVQNKGSQDITHGITHWYASGDINVEGLRVRNSGTYLYIHGPGNVRVNGEVWVQDGGFLQLQEGVTMQIMNTKAGVNSYHVVTGGQLRVYGSAIGGKVDTSPPVSTGVAVSGVGSLFHSEYATIQASTGVVVDSGTIYADHLTQGTYPDALYVTGTGTLELKNSTMPLGVAMDAAAGAGSTYRPDLRRDYPGWRSTVVSPSGGNLPGANYTLVVENSTIPQWFINVKNVKPWLAATNVEIGHWSRSEAPTYVYPQLDIMGGTIDQYLKTSWSMCPEDCLDTYGNLSCQSAVSGTYNLGNMNFIFEGQGTKLDAWNLYLYWGANVTLRAPSANCARMVEVLVRDGSTLTGWGYDASTGRRGMQLDNYMGNVAGSHSKIELHSAWVGPRWGYAFLTTSDGGIALFKDFSVRGAALQTAGEVYWDTSSCGCGGGGGDARGGLPVLR
jgi:hypothetical protein